MKTIKHTIPALTLSLSLAIAAPAQAVDFTLFGSAGYSGSSEEGANDGFALGPLDFYATTQLDDKTRGFIEYVFENGGDGLVTDLERVWVARDINDSMTLGIGRFHSPLGSWNRTYHHGAYMQNTISRPFFLDFEDGAAGVLPVHIVGLMSWGEIPVSWGSVSYEVFVSNGPSIDSDGGLSVTPDNKPEIGIGDAGDSNSNKAIGGRVSFTPEEGDLEASFFFYSGSIAEDGTGINFPNISTGDDLIDQVITGVDASWDIDSFNIALEYYSFNNDSLIAAQESHTGTAYYLQGTWQASENLKVIVRQEDLDFDNNDNYFQLLGASPGSHALVAVRYELTETNALKFEINRSSPAVGPSETGFAMEWAFIMF